MKADRGGRDHAELIRREGKYWELVRRQQLEEEVETT